MDKFLQQEKNKDIKGGKTHETEHFGVEFK
jgi:hypothetical protein